MQFELIRLPPELPYEHDSDTQYYKPAPNWGYRPDYE